ncbi:MAG TPA: lipopolysaccharide kinase InaA family protein [Urbifossiella sp.]|jgi:tRNA A-37 threonylcarbamoyl transferase component Bud32
MFSHFLRKLASFGSWRSAGRSTLRQAGRRWHLAPNAWHFFDDSGLDLDRWIDDGSAQIVKTGSHRTVYRVELPIGTVFVKHCRINGLRAWFREVLRPAKARLEFENLLAVQNRGIASVVPLAWGVSDCLWPGESFLITRSLDGFAPFLEHLEGPLSAGDCRELAGSLGRFIAKLHDSGIAHPDPHPGNLLVATTDGRCFALIDLHAIRLSRPLSWSESRANLVLFNRWFQLRASRTDRLRFWKAYRQSRLTLPVPVEDQFADQARAVERGTAASNLRFWASRRSRCRGANRYFQCVRTKLTTEAQRKIEENGDKPRIGFFNHASHFVLSVLSSSVSSVTLWLKSSSQMRGHAVRDIPEEKVNNLTANPDSHFEQCGIRILKDSRTSTVAELPGNLILKRVNVRHWFEPIKNLLRPSAVLRSWMNGHALRDRWLPTPRPLAVWHRYRFGLPAEGYLLTEKVEATPLTEPSRSSLFQLARTLRQMHDRGISHRDLKASNILLEGGRDPVLIDLVGVRLGKKVSFRQRAKELARLNASFLASPFATRSERLRFLRTYLSAGDGHLAGWKNWWNAISRATVVKQAKNRRSGRPLA